MEVLASVMPVVIDVLIAILLIVLIILTIKVIGVVDDARVLLDDIIEKVNSLNGIFSVINKIDAGVNGIAKNVIKLFQKVSSKFAGRKQDDDVSDEEEELENILKGRE